MLIELPRATYPVTTETHDGSVDVSVPRDDPSSPVVTARTGDGKVTVRNGELTGPCVRLEPVGE